MTHLISVVIPTFNDEAYSLRRAIESVLNQSLENISIIIVDDGSDTPFSGLDKQFTDYRLKWVRHSENKGVAASRNSGINQANGDYIAFLDSDDWWDSEKLYEQYKAITQTGARWVYCGITVCMPDGRNYIELPEYKGSIFEKLLTNQFITGSASSVIVEAGLLDEVGGFNVKDNLVEDWDLWIRLSKIAPVEYVSKPMVYLSAYNSNSRSGMIHKKSIRLKNLIHKHRDDISRHGLERYALARMHIVVGRRYLVQGCAVRGVIHWIKSLRYNPLMFPVKWLPIALLAIIFPKLYRKIHIYRRLKA